MSGRLPSVELGSRPRGGTSQIYQCFLPSALPLAEEAGSRWWGSILSTVRIPSQLWKTMHPSTQLHQRGRLPRIMETLDSCLWLYMQLLNVILIWRPFMYLRHASQLFWRYWEGKQNKTKKSFNSDMPLSVFPNPPLVLDVMKAESDRVSLCTLAIWTLSQCALLLNLVSIISHDTTGTLYVMPGGCIRKLWSYIHDF